MIFTPFAFMATPPTPGGFDSDYQAVLDYATTQGYTKPSVAQQTIQNQLVVDMKAAGIAWSDLSLFYVMATDGSSEYAGINWADPNNFELTQVGSPTFITDEGFQGNGSSMALNTGFTPTTDWGTSTDVSMGGWADLDNAVGTIIGSFDTERTHLIHKWTDGNTYVSLGGNASGTGVEPQTDGLWTVENNSSGDNILKVNNSTIDTVGVGATGFSTVPLSIIARRRGGGAYDGWGSSKYQIAFYGTRNVAQNIYSSIDTYMTAISTPTSLLDDYPGAIGAYSLRKLSSTYTGAAIEVRRSSDNTTQDIGFVGEGLDITAMETFVGAGNGFVSTWYDQSGNGNDQAQATDGEQPQIVSSGTTITQGGLPTLQFSSDRFSRSNIINVNADKTTFNVYYPTAINTAQPIMDLSSTTGTGASWNLGVETALRCFGRTYVTTAGTVNTYSLLEMWQDGITIDDANQFKMYLNGTYIPRASGTGGTLASATSPFTIGWSTNGGSYFAGTQQEIVIYDSSLSDANREGARDNINAYYSVY